jgi:hypothetical protein
MAGAHRDVAERQRLQDPPDAALVHRHEKACQDPLPQIAQPPANDAVFSNIRPLTHPGRKLRLLLDSQLRGRTTAVQTVRQAVDPLLIVADNPVAQGLPIHAAVLGGLCTTVTLKHQCQSQKPPSNTGLANTRRMSAQRSRIVIPPRDLHRHCHSPRIQNGQTESYRLELAKLTYESTHLSAGIRHHRPRGALASALQT